MKTTVQDFSKVARFEYPVISLSSVSIKHETDPTTGKNTISTIRIGDEEFLASSRFLTSLYARFGFNARFFQYFTPDEVLARIIAKHESDQLRVCIGRFSSHGSQYSSLLAASSPTNGVAHADAVLKLFEAYGSEGLTYTDGQLVSVHSPRVAPQFNVGGDTYTNKFTMTVPIDAYGGPYAMLALHRLSTQANIVAQSKMFRSDLKLGKANDDLEASLGRALDSFNNDEGYAAVRERLESAATSWCSVQESESFRLLMNRFISYGMAKYNPDAPGISSGRSVVASNLSLLQHVSEQAMENRGNMLMQAFHKMTGNVQEQLGFANLESLSEKRRRSLPVKCRVLDLLNFASEVTSFHSTGGHEDFNQWIGGVMSNEYDIEGSMAVFPDFEQFWTDRKFGKAVQEEAAAN